MVWFGALGEHFLDDVRHLKDGADFFVQFFNRERRRRRRPADTPEGARFEVFHARLRQRRNAGQRGRAFFARHRERREPLGVEVGNDAGDRREHHADVTREQVGGCGRAAFVRHVHDVRPGRRLEHLRRDMARLAEIGRAHV